MIKPLIGHFAAQQTLANMISAGNIPNALMLTGVQGIGKRLLAEHFAWRLICGAGEEGANLSHNPQSPMAPVLAAGACPQLVILEKLADKSSISVEQIRALRNNLSLATEGWRVIILDTADDLTPQAANALLKMLEEPSPQTVFVVLCHSISATLPTVISRCRVIKLSKLSYPDTMHILQKNGVEEGLEPLVTLAAGQPGWVLSALQATELTAPYFLEAAQNSSMLTERLTGEQGNVWLDILASFRHKSWARP
jgi:DNA polymerase-3 subunit delta'